MSEINSFNLVDFIDYVNVSAQNSTNMLYEITQISAEEPVSITKDKIDRYVLELAYEKQLYLLDKKINSELDDSKRSELMEKKGELIKNKNKFLKGKKDDNRN